ncbi:MAG TPA: biotin synthase BioB [bacterium]|nr:biotin synthase BioB [bacterium]
MKLAGKVLKGEEITFEEASLLSELKGKDIFSLLNAANVIREKFKGKVIDLCSVINAKSGRCSEDCRFCSQSTYYKTAAQIHPLVGSEEIIKAAKRARNIGADRFGIVISGRSIPGLKELNSICEALRTLSAEVDIGRCASLGTLTREAAQALREAGLESYHHNLETAESFFGSICTTHKFSERVNTIRIAKEAGLKVCCGGIFGLGETWKERIELALTLRELDVDSVPLNILNPIPGTPLENAQPLPPLEILKIIAIYRFILPTKDIRVCGGREVNLRDLQSFIFLAGANGTMIGNYLTTSGRDPREDIRMIRDLGLRYRNLNNVKY